LCVGERFGGAVGGLEGAFGVVEGAELHGDAGADADEGGQGAFVEGRRAFVLEDARGAVQGAAVFVGGLEADFDDVEGLAWEMRGRLAWFLVTCGILCLCFR
jgi:hypothetical protein